MRGVRIRIRLLNTAGNSAITPLIRGPTTFDSVTTMATSVATSAARNGMSYQRLVTSGILAARKRCTSGRQSAKAAALKRMPPASDHSNARTAIAPATHMPNPATRLISRPHRCTSDTNTSDISTVAAFMGRLATALCAMNASSWSMARKM